ncbi:MAG: acetylxylan esterase [Bacteroidales bacterium]|nr:acetylxylan esterase [Bacteroidales bacterium]
MKTTRLLFAALAVLLLAQTPATAQFPGMPRINRDSLHALSVQDHARMLGQLGLTAVRPGRDSNSPDPARQPNYDEFTANPYYIYPDPLTTFAGKPVRDPQTWYRERRPELVRVFEDELYGRLPAVIPAVRWEVVKEEKVMMEDVPCIYRELAGVVDNSACPTITVRIQASVTWPESAGRNLPVVAEFGYALGNFNFTFPGVPKTKSWQQQVVERGWAAAVIVTGSIQPDGGYGLNRGIIGLCNRGADRKPEDWGTLRAWGWGLSKLIDYFETDPQFDAAKVALEGCSRNGKAALVAMAFDERIAAGFISSSGKGGAAPWRRNCGEALENLSADGEYHWMAGNFLKYGADPLCENDIPVDQHELIALCAPRPCLVSGGLPEGDRWQDIIGMFIATSKASPVYELLGARGLPTDIFPGPDQGLMDGELAFRQHHGGHESGPNWPYFLDFFDKFVVSRKL